MAIISNLNAIAEGKGTRYIDGVPASGAGGSAAGLAPTGALLVNNLTGIAYSNVGTQIAPNWVKVSTT